MCGQRYAKVTCEFLHTCEILWMLDLKMGNVKQVGTRHAGISWNYHTYHFSPCSDSMSCDSPALRFKGLDKKVLDIDIQGAKALSQCIVSKSWFLTSTTLFLEVTTFEPMLQILSNNTRNEWRHQFQPKAHRLHIFTYGRMSCFNPWLSPGPPGGLHCDQNRHRATKPWQQEQ